MGIGTAVANVNQRVLVFSDRVVSERKWEKFGKLAGKILVVALVVAVLAAATYFSMGLAIPLFMGVANFSWGALAATFGMIGLATTGLTTPFLALDFNMHRVTHHNLSDCYHFVRGVVGSVFVGLFAYLFRFSRGIGLGYR